MLETAYTSAATQRRDAQVLGIMRRVRSKLEGRDFGVQHKMSVHEQVMILQKGRGYNSGINSFLISRLPKQLNNHCQWIIFVPCMKAGQVGYKQENKRARRLLLTTNNEEE